MTSMSTRAYQAAQDRKLKREIADKDREVARMSAQGTYARGKAAQTQAQINKQDLIRKTNADDYHRVVEFPFNAVKSIGDLAVKGIANDPEWYKNFPELTAVIGNLEQYAPVGRNLWNKLDLSSYAIDNIEAPARIPSVMMIEYVDMIGRSMDTNYHSQLPINVSTQRVITNARANNSRIGGYAVGDMAQVLLASAHVYIFLAWIRRGIRIAQSFDENKKALRESLLTAGGYNSTFFLDHLPEIKGKFATLLEDANANLFVPSKYDILHRKLFLVDNVFLDSDSKYAPMYIFSPKYFWYYVEDEAAIKPYPTSTIGSVADLQSLFSTMMRDLMYSEEITNMISDLKFAFRNDNFTMDMPDMKEKLTFASGYEPILEIRNMLMPLCGNNISLLNRESQTGYLYIARPSNQPLVQSLTIKQDERGFVYQGYSETYDKVYIQRGQNVAHIGTPNQYEYIATPTDALTSDEVLAATRLMPRYDLGQDLYSQLGMQGNNHRATYISSCGTEIVTYVTVFTSIAPEEREDGDRVESAEFYPFINVTKSFEIDNLLVGDLKLMMSKAFASEYAFANFNARPRLKLFNIPLTTIPPTQQSNAVSVTEFDDIQYYAHKFPISWENLDLLTSACNKSLYYINMPIKTEKVKA